MYRAVPNRPRYTFVCQYLCQLKSTSACVAPQVSTEGVPPLSVAHVNLFLPFSAPRLFFLICCFSCSRRKKKSEEISLKTS